MRGQKETKDQRGMGRSPDRERGRHKPHLGSRASRTVSVTDALSFPLETGRGATGWRATDSAVDPPVLPSYSDKSLKRTTLLTNVLGT